MFLLCLKGDQKGRRYFSFPISAHPVIPTSLALSLAHLSIEWSLSIQTFTNRLRVSKALCGVSKLAHEAELNVNAFYRTRSTQGNPELNGPRGSTGMQFTIRPLRKSVASITDRPAVPANIN